MTQVAMEKLAAVDWLESCVQAVIQMYFDLPDGVAPDFQRLAYRTLNAMLGPLLDECEAIDYTDPTWINWIGHIRGVQRMLGELGQEVSHGERS